MATTTASARKTVGGGFLLQDVETDRIFTYEDLTDEHLDIGRTVDAFAHGPVPRQTQAGPRPACVCEIASGAREG